MLTSRFANREAWQPLINAFPKQPDAGPLAMMDPPDRKDPGQSTAQKDRRSDPVLQVHLLP